MAALVAPEEMVAAEGAKEAKEVTAVRVAAASAEVKVAVAKEVAEWVLYLAATEAGGYIHELRLCSFAGKRPTALLGSRW